VRCVDGESRGSKMMKDLPLPVEDLTEWLAPDGKAVEVDHRSASTAPIKVEPSNEKRCE